jgi:adenylate cyclase
MEPMLKHPLPYCLSSGSLLLALLLYGHTSTLLQRAELLLYDLWLPDTPALTDPRIQIVDIDEHSLATVGRWPWPRDQLARLLEKTLAQSPAAVGLDILLPEPGARAGDQKLDRLLQDPRVITATSFALKNPAARHRNGWPEAIDQIAIAPSLAPCNVAHIMPIHGIDGVIRRLPPIVCRANGDCYPAMALSLLEKLTNSQAHYDPHNHQLCISTLCQPLNRARELLIPYLPGTTFPRTSAAGLLSGQAEIPPGSVVLIGSSATGLGDIITTPVSPRTPGILIHANIISAWLDNYSLHPLHPARALYLGFWLLSLSGICLWGASRARPHKLAALALILLPLPLQLGIWFSHYWLDPVPGLILLAWALLSITGLQLRQSQTSRRQLQQAFASYVPPIVLEQLSRSGKNLRQLDAQRAEISVLFADIQGFTALSEQMTPEQLVQLTNLLFTELTEAIHTHHGTLDKYMGDAVMAFWGAPLPQHDHAELALRCARAMQARVQRLRPRLMALGLPPVQICIGLESGLVIAGNLGAEQRRAYTVLGSAVNTAARIQTAASDMDIAILLGPNLCTKLPPGLPTRPRVRRQLKGISTPLQLSVPVGEH